MSSLVHKHFPEIRFQGGQKWLWNPIRKKRLANRPEEQVRLQLIDYLILEAGWPKSRITTEIPVENPVDATPIRADILCYDQNFDPLLLVECKRPSVTLNEKAAEQLARYNRRIKAPWLMLCNGKNDRWYRVNETDIERFNTVPDMFKSKQTSFRKEADYWIRRGFIGTGVPDDLKDWLVQLLPVFWKHTVPVFVPVDASPANVELEHFYRIYQPEKDSESQLAVSLIATRDGNTKLAGILNRAGQTAALWITGLDQWMESNKENTTVYTPEGNIGVDVQESLHLDRLIFEETDISKLLNRMYNRLNEYS